MDQQQTINRNVNESVYMIQVQLRLTEDAVEEIDRLVRSKKYKSRSDAIRAILRMHNEREKTRKFFEMLVKEREDARKHPEKLIPIEELG